jgi:hypothetical protein
MPSPMEQFIENFFRINQFTEQQRQFNESQALAQRQVENAEINSFMDVAQYVQDPGELGALAEFHALKNPAMAPVYQELAANMLPSVAAAQAGAVHRGIGAMQQNGTGAALDAAATTSVIAGMTPGALREDTVRAGFSPERTRQTLDIRDNVALGATGIQDESQFSRQLAESSSQFAQTMSNQREQFGQTMGLNWEQLAQQERLTTAGQMLSAGYGNDMFVNQYQQRLAEIDRELGMTTILRPEYRAQLEQEQRDLQSNIARLRAQSAAQVRTSAVGGMDINQIVTGMNAAYDNAIAGRTEGEIAHSVAVQNFLGRLLESQTQGAFKYDPMGVVNPWWSGPKSDLLEMR